jgi:hypothetical protein
MIVLILIGNSNNNLEKFATHRLHGMLGHNAAPRGKLQGIQQRRIKLPPGPTCLLNKSGVGEFFNQSLVWLVNVISSGSGHCLNVLGIVKKEQLVTKACS